MIRVKEDKNGDLEKNKIQREPLTILSIGDPHFKVKNVSDTEKMVDRLVEIAEQKKPDLIVILGDVLDTHEKIHVEPLNNAINMFRKLKKFSPLVILIGNHDRPNNSDYLSGRHPFSAVKEWKDVTVVDQTSSQIIHGHSLVFVPYVPPGRFQDALDEIKWPEPEIIFAHQEFRGAKMGAIISSVGDEWGEDRPLVISGHIHDYQQLQTNLIYTGTPLQHAFGDSSDKTVSWLNISSDQKITHTRIEMGLPKKKMVYLLVKEVEYYEPPSNSQLKIIIKGFPYEIRVISKSLKVSQWLEQGIKISYKALKENTEKKVDCSRKNYQNMLYQECCQEQETKVIYEELFGRNS